MRGLPTPAELACLSRMGKFSGCRPLAMPASAVVRKSIQNVLSKLPSMPHCDYAYGSYVFSQANNQPTSGSMVDIIRIVPDSISFHRENVRLNPKHYSALLRILYHLSAGMFDFLTNRLLYNIVSEEDCILKYGVVGIRDLERDLLDWNELYLAGRFHKPVLCLSSDPSMQPRVYAAIQKNRLSALEVSLSLLPARFTLHNLLCTATALSYNGDFRMAFAENPQKICNIVDGQKSELHDIYVPLLETQIPAKIRRIDFESFEKTAKYTAETLDLPKAVAQKLENSPSLGLQRALSSIVFRSSILQAVWGLFSVHFLISVRYAASKIKKRFF